MPAQVAPKTQAQVDKLDEVTSGTAYVTPASLVTSLMPMLNVSLAQSTTIKTGPVLLYVLIALHIRTQVEILVQRLCRSAYAFLGTMAR